ncbi:hypothetical protein [Prosthecomicrobium sp. N25]|uniref:hypothetical protein n=1 Tax=Prosthecomicrobium sp. N25 TaxID=3129254 RepID=UPI003076C65C
MAKIVLEDCHEIRVQGLVTAAGGQLPIYYLGRIITSARERKGKRVKWMTRVQVSMEADLKGTLKILPQPGADWQEIELQAIPAPLGGFRAFAICPATGKRVTALYMPVDGKKFLSRHAHDLAYASHNIPTERRLEWRRGQLLSLMDLVSGMEIRKPKGMHWSTFDRLLAAYDEVDEEILRRDCEKIGITWP